MGNKQCFQKAPVPTTAVHVPVQVPVPPKLQEEFKKNDILDEKMSDAFVLYGKFMVGHVAQDNLNFIVKVHALRDLMAKGNASDDELVQAYEAMYVVAGKDSYTGANLPDKHQLKLNALKKNMWRDQQGQFTGLDAAFEWDATTKVAEWLSTDQITINNVLTESEESIMDSFIRIRAPDTSVRKWLQKMSSTDKQSLTARRR